MPRELSTGLVIAGAYADKLRRTLFAQLRDMVRQDKEFAREVARASGEINRLLYIILVDKLKADKGDVVRIRVQYDVEDGKIKWYYDTLRLEYFKRVPDEQVMETVKQVINEKLKEVQAQYAEVPSKEEAEAILKGEKEEFKISEKVEETKEIMGETKPLEKQVEVKPEVAEEVKAVEVPIDLTELIKEATPIGETMEGGIVFELKDKDERNIGIASIEPRAGTYIAEAVVLPKPGEAYKIYLKLEKSIEEYKSDPTKLLKELLKTKPVKISTEDAREFLESKMESII